MTAVPLLAVEGLHMVFGGLVANRDISFSVEAGEIIGLIGPNGAGKTTLFNCLAGFYTPSAGSIPAGCAARKRTPPFSRASRSATRTGGSSPSLSR